jgi:hypothetical protein
MSFFMSSSHLFFWSSYSIVNIGFHLYTLYTLLTFDVNSQTNITFVRLCSLLCSYVLLIYLIICFGSPCTISFFCRPKDLSYHFPFKYHQLTFMVPFKPLVSQAYVTNGLITLQYKIIFNLLETNLLLKRNWLAWYALFPSVILFRIS